MEPHRVSDADIERARKYYTDVQILEMIISVAGNNSTNRWKEGIGVPQSQNGGNFGRRPEAAVAESTPAAPRPDHNYLTPTSEKFQTKVSQVAPVAVDESTGKPLRATICRRPVLESRAEVEQSLQACKSRTARLPLVDEAKAHEVLGEDAPRGHLPQWMRLLAHFPRDGKRLVGTFRSAEEKGNLAPLFKAQVSWIVARQDRAWYALALAKRRLLELGQTEDQVYALDGAWDGFTPAERSLFNVAKKLSASPMLLSDDDVARAVEHAGPRDVVQLISYTTSRASFNRITEAAGLQLE